jgi:hypothetical protein
MSLSRNAPLILAALLAGFLALAGCALSTPARAAEGLEWRLEQPRPPASESGVQPEVPVGLGRIGDIEFWAPNKGLLITDGNGNAVPPGVWVYDGEGWHELAKEACGATDGRIAWAGPDEFWTVSDGRKGQAANGANVEPPLEDDTLCRFAYDTATQKLEVLDSYATLAFQASSYQAMDAAACTSPADCWFAGGPLPAPQQGAFQLHWNGNSLEAEPNTNRRVETVEDMRDFQGQLLESIALPLEEQTGEEEPEEILHPSVIQEMPPEGASTAFTEVHPRSQTNQILPEYAPPSSEFSFGSFPQALEGLRLSANESSLWAAAGPVAKPPAESAPAKLTVLRDSGGTWTQVLGPEGTAEAEAGSGKVVPANLASDVVNSIAAEPGASEEAWLALDTRTDVSNPKPTEYAHVVHVGANGSLSEETLPSASEGGGGKGAATKIVCPAQNDCWMATTQGWLFHLSTKEAREHPEASGEPAFSGGYLITYRPPDKGVPQEPSDTLAVDDSGLEESGPPSTGSQLVKTTAPSPFVSVSVPLLSDVHSRLIHGSTLELSFHLAVKASVRLLAKRHSKLVASTPTRVLKAGKRSLELKLNPARWPTKLSLKTHALAPLPTVSSLSSGVETVSTSLAFPNALGISGWGPSL